jgi:hypothetical protein
MTLLGKLLRSIRLRRNISELKAARRASMSLEQFVEYEYSPENVPFNELAKIFEAIEMNEQEYIEFSALSNRLQKSPKNAALRSIKLSNFLTKKKSNRTENILVFQDRRGIKQTTLKNTKDKPKKTE